MLSIPHVYNYTPSAIHRRGCCPSTEMRPRLTPLHVRRPRTEGPVSKRARPHARTRARVQVWERLRGRRAQASKRGAFVQLLPLMHSGEYSNIACCPRYIFPVVPLCTQAWRAACARRRDLHAPVAIPPVNPPARRWGTNKGWWRARGSLALGARAAAFGQVRVPHQRRGARTHARSQRRLGCNGLAATCLCSSRAESHGRPHRGGDYPLPGPSA